MTAVFTFTLPFAFSFCFDFFASFSFAFTSPAAVAVAVDGLRVFLAAPLTWIAPGPGTVMVTFFFFTLPIVKELSGGPGGGGGVTGESTASPQGLSAPVMKFWSTPVPSRLARPIVSPPALPQ